jgi:NAD(P)H-dependent FMN reductase
MNNHNDKNTKPARVKIVGISGSLRPGSYTRKAVRIALEGAKEAGADTQLLDLGDYDLPFSSGNPRDRNYPPGVFMLREDIKSADGVILGSPEYHGGMSGVLKNALDLTGFKEFEGKLIGLVGVSGGLMGATNALVSLRNVGRALHAWVIPEQVSIPQAWRKFNQDGSLDDETIRKRLQNLGQEVAHYSFLHTSANQMVFLNEWQDAPVNPGGARKREN